METETTANATQNAESKVTETSAAEVTTQDPAKATQDQTNVETKVEETPKTETTAKVVPEKYELKLAEGSFLKQADIDAVSAKAKEMGLSNEEAQAVLDGKHQEISGFYEQRKAEYAKQVEGWKEEILKDPVVGGDQFAQSAEYAKRAIEKFGTPELQNLMDTSGFGNNPEVFKFFAKLGREAGDDSFVKAGAQSVSREQSREDKLYPTMAKK